jgi:hypothetical protein
MESMNGYGSFNVKNWSSMVRTTLGACLVCASAASVAAGFNSGSTGADGAFNPTGNQTVVLPPSGVLNYTSVNIPAGVTITFQKNAANTPVTILVSGDVTVAGTIDVSGKAAGGDGTMGGIAGPGGYDGGHGGLPADKSVWVTSGIGPTVGRAGIGPGGGAPGIALANSSVTYGVIVGSGSGGAFATSPASANPGNGCTYTPGTAYGNPTLLPLIGGSGGGGAAGSAQSAGAGGGGGGGAILIAASGTINVTGSILANGGNGISYGGVGFVWGAGGSGGAIRLVATTISGNGTISAKGGTGADIGSSATSSSGGYTFCSAASSYTAGTAGRIRLEAASMVRTASSTPIASSDQPGPLTLPGTTPTVAITTIGGVTVPANPTGSNDVTLAATANPVTVIVTTTGVTVGSTVTLTLAPPTGPATTTAGVATTGTLDKATANVSLTLPVGPNTIVASVTYTVSANASASLLQYTQGEQVARVRLDSALGGASKATLITVTGKEFAVPAERLAGING